MREAGDVMLTIRPDFWSRITRPAAARQHRQRLDVDGERPLP